MARAFDLLLDATLAHVRALQLDEVRFVEVSPETLALLRRGRTGNDVERRKLPTAVTSESAPGQRRIHVSPGPPAVLPVVGPSSRPDEGAAAEAGFQEETPRLNVGRAGAVSGAQKVAAMDALRERALVCQKCPHLVRSRTQVVFGVGDIDAELMFVGEAPGAEEDRLGEPFVGPAGQLLTRIIGAMGIDRDKVYIANILKCRPDMPTSGRGNRPPRPEEMETCKPYLVSQIEIIRPKVMVALGLTAVQGLLGIQGTMGSVRGRWHAFNGIPVMPTFHPSYLLRAEDAPDRGHLEKRKTWEDMLLVLEKLNRPITERMRGFFLKLAG